MLMTALTH